MQLFQTELIVSQNLDESIWQYVLVAECQAFAPFIDQASESPVAAELVIGTSGREIEDDVYSVPGQVTKRQLSLVLFLSGNIIIDNHCI